MKDSEDEGLYFSQIQTLKVEFATAPLSPNFSDRESQQYEHDHRLCTVPEVCRTCFIDEVRGKTPFRVDFSVGKINTENGSDCLSRG